MRPFFARLIACLHLAVKAACVGLLVILVLAAGFDYLVALTTPPARTLRLRIVALAAKCRHRIVRAGGLFVEAALA